MSGALLVLLKRYMFPYLYSLIFMALFCNNTAEIQKYKFKMDTHTHADNHKSYRWWKGEISHQKTPSTAHVSSPCHKPTQVNRKYWYLTTTTILFKIRQHQRHTHTQKHSTNYDVMQNTKRKQQNYLHPAEVWSIAHSWCMPGHQQEWLGPWRFLDGKGWLFL